MPAIYLFNRKTLLGGDDLHIPCIFGMFLRVIQLTAFLIPLWLHIHNASDGHLWTYITYDEDNTSLDCRNAHIFALLLVLYAFLSTVMTFLSFLWEARIYQVSSWDSPSDTQPRSRTVERLLELKLFHWAICQAMVIALGIAVMSTAPHHHACRRSSSKEDSDDLWFQITAWMTDDDRSSSTSRVWWIAYSLLWFSQLIELLFQLGVVLQLHRQSPQASLTQTHNLHHELVEEMWQERCLRFCECLGWSTCFMFGGRNVRMGEFGDVARALADYLEAGGVLDLVPSDVAAGVMVLQLMQRKRRLEAREALVGEVSGAGMLDSTRLLEGNGSSLRQRTPFYVMHGEGSQTYYEPTSRKVLSQQNAIDLSTLAEGARFARYQLAIYTFLLYMYEHPASGLPRLLKKRSGCLCCRWRRRDDEDDDVGEPFMACEDEQVIGNDLCGIHKAALLLQAEIEDTDLIYAQLHSSFSEIPYCILVDHEWKSVVLAIRGTFSLEDCVADVMVDPESLEELGTDYGFDGTDQYCHGGVLICARIVMSDLQRHRILERLLLGDEARYPSYTLRVVGHSLGAATATLISYMLRPKFTTLRCLNYSPPGCSFTWRMATECHEWCLAFVLDSDLVPRLTLDTMEHLRDEVLDLFGKIKVPKIDVARKVLGTHSSRRAPLRDQQETLQRTIDEILHERDEIPLDSNYQQQLLTFVRVQSERKATRGHLRSVRLFPPGRIVHFMKTSEKKNFTNAFWKCLTCHTTNVGSQYTPVLVNNDDFNEIVVSITMGTDHFPNRMCSTMQKIAADYGIDTTQEYTTHVEEFP